MVYNQVKPQTADPRFPCTGTGNGILVMKFKGGFNLSQEGCTDPLPVDGWKSVALEQ